MKWTLWPLLLVLATGGCAARAAETHSGPACSAVPYHQFDFWLGTWSVRNAHGKLLGRNTITKEQNGCAIVERWQSARGISGTSVNSYDADDGRWHETWVDSTGGLLVLDGSAQHDGMLLAGTMHDRRYGTVRDRIEWSRLPNGVVRQHFSESRDGGQSWNDLFDGYSTRDAVQAVTVRDAPTHALPAMNGKRLSLHVVQVTYAPGASSKPHTHPCPVSVYVASGEVAERIDNGPTHTYGAGDTFYEPPNHVHAVSANPSRDRDATFVATFICDTTAPLSSPVRSH